MQKRKIWGVSVILPLSMILLLLVGCYYIYSLKVAIFGKEYYAAMEQLQGDDIGYFGAKWYWIEYETGRTDESAFATVLGDNGAAFGIQFDYRYTLQSFLVYCVQQDPGAYSMFKPFTTVSKESLKGNQDLANAWLAAYNYHKEDFIEKQKEYCEARYYVPAENALKAKGIKIEDRSEVCKGAILSFVFQGCSPGIAKAVENAGITNNSTDQEFIEKIYTYRANLYPRFKSRYDREKQTALYLLEVSKNGNFAGSVGAFVSPCPGAYVSSEYGPRTAPTAGASSYHRGRDYAAASGTPILATANGQVKSVLNNNIRGNYIVIDHGNGIESWYQHCTTITASVGQIVKAGQKIATVGTTGISTGAHLHFEIHVNGETVDPRTYLIN